MKKIIYALALLLPLIVLGVESGLHTWHMTSAPKYRVVIEGYDPRDLVYGEHLQYRFKWNDPASQKPEVKESKDLPEFSRIYLPEGNAWDLQTMMWEKKQLFTVDARLMGKKVYADNLKINGKPWQEALDVWRQNRDNQPR